MTAPFLLVGSAGVGPLPVDFVRRDDLVRDEAVSVVGRSLQSRADPQRRQRSATQLAHDLWDRLDDLVDDLDVRLLTTLVWRPIIGFGLLDAGYLLMEIVPEVHAFSVRPSQGEGADEEDDDSWVISAHVGLEAEEAFARLALFDTIWVELHGGLVDVIPTIELA